MLLIYIADVIWVVSLSLIAGASRQALRRVPADTTVPSPLGRRVARRTAFVLLPVVATVVGLGLLVAARGAESPDAQLLLFGVRAFTASAFALLHFLWLTSALRTLAAEGALKP
jgi:hypothetical protein